MSTSLIQTLQPNPFGKNRERKGGKSERFREIMKDCSNKFPIESMIPVGVLDKWIWESNYANKPNVDFNDPDYRKSYEWKGWTQSRNQFRKDINAEAAHPQTIDLGIKPFVIEFDGEETLKVVDPYIQMGDGKYAEKVPNVLAAEMKKIGSLSKAEKWENLPQYLRNDICELHDVWETWKGTNELQAKQLKRQANRIINMLQGEQIQLALPESDDNEPA